MNRTENYEFTAYAEMVDLIDSLFFGDAVKAIFAKPNELFQNNGGIEEIILGKNRGTCIEAHEINEAFTTGKDVTVEFNKKKVGGNNVLYESIVRVEDNKSDEVTLYSFSDIYREKGNQRTILKSDLKGLK